MTEPCLDCAYWQHQAKQLEATVGKLAAAINKFLAEDPDRHSAAKEVVKWMEEAERP